jgi:outer membrane protein assembly factor BamA
MWDTRDNVLWPLRGRYMEVYGMADSPFSGSEYTFIRMIADARQFIPVQPGHVAGIQFYAEYLAGTAPFSVLPGLGGRERLRGYYEGRFRDRFVTTVQAEYRMPLVWRFSGVVFGGAGNVAPSPALPDPGLTKFFGGIGTRFRMTPQGLRLRLDYAHSREGGALYITFVEAF